MTSVRLTPHQTEVLENLLGRLERSSEERAITLAVNAERFPAYFANDRPQVVKAWEEELRQLESLGWISLDRGRGAESHLLTRIRLNRAQTAQIESALGRMNLANFRAAMAESARKHIADAASGEPAAVPPWLLRYFEDELEAAGSLNCRAQDRPDVLAETQLLYTALLSLSGLERPMSWRQFSVTQFGKSKRLDHVKDRIGRILARYFLGLDGETPEPSAVLSHFGIEAKEEVLFLGGSIRLWAGDRIILDSRDWKPFAAFPVSTALAPGYRIDWSLVASILTVENEETFHSLAKRRSGNEAVLYLGGFPSRGRLQLLSLAVAAELPISHWGDLDCGGIDIFLFLERKLKTRVIPFLMSPEVLRRHRQAAQPLSPAERNRLVALRRNWVNDTHALAPTVDEMLELGMKLEQEAVLLEPDLQP